MVPVAHPHPFFNWKEKKCLSYEKLFFGSQWVSTQFSDLSLYLYLIKPNKI